MKVKRLARVAGIVAIVPFALLLVLLPIGFFTGPFPGWVLAIVFFGLLAAIPLAIFSAFFWNKWLFAVAALATVIIVVTVAYLPMGHLG